MKQQDSRIEYERNESGHFDLMGWLDSLENLGVNIAKEFPAVKAANDRVDQLVNLRAKHANTTPELNMMARRLGLAEDLDDGDAILSTADHFAYSQDPEHRARVKALLAAAADFARGAAIKRFHSSPVLDIMRPAFDALAERIVTASRTIPQGVINVGDAARLGHADAYVQLEHDLTTWDDIASLIDELHDAKVLTADRPERWPAEFMMNDVDACKEAGGSAGHPLRRATAIAAGVPHLHLPTGGEVIPPAFLGSAEDTKNRWAAADANDADKAARENLGLPALTR